MYDRKINGKLATDTVSNDVVAILPAGPMHGKQTMLYPENYFTESIWRGILDSEARDCDVYMPIVAVLVRVGLSRPQETFWGSLVATLQWGSNNPNFDAGQVRDSMKRMWKNFRFIIPTIPDAPTEYPTMPSKLLDTHPELYHRAYPLHQPVAPPSHLETLKLSWLRSTTGSRCTKHRSSVLLQNNGTSWLSKRCWCSERCVRNVSQVCAHDVDNPSGSLWATTCDYIRVGIHARLSSLYVPPRSAKPNPRLCLLRYSPSSRSNPSSHLH